MYGLKARTLRRGRRPLFVISRLTDVVLKEDSLSRNYVVCPYSLLYVLFCMAAFFVPANGNCQTAGTGSIQGSVSDPTGAVIQNGSVTLTNTATQVQHATKSGADGLYSFPNIPVGVYTLDVSAQGFEHYSQAEIVLEVGCSIGINVNMTVGQAAQRVEVRTNGIALKTEDR